MPSGAKKRKAAKRKKEMDLMALRPANPPQVAGRHDDPVPAEVNKESDGGSPTSSSSSSSPARENHRSRSAESLFGPEAVVIDRVAEGAEGAAFAEEDEEESAVAVKEAAVVSTIDSVTQLEVSVVEFAKSEKEDEKPAEDSAVPVEKIVALAEEVRQVDEVAAKVFEETSGERRVEVVVPLPVVDADGDIKQLGESREACRVAGEAETSPTTEVAPRAPLVVHHAKWWHCCGLLAVFAGSGR